MGKTLTELMSANISNAIVSQKTWGGVIVLANNYGAKPDAADNTDAIQKAIDAARELGKREVYFLPGSYAYTTLQNTEDMVFVGDGVSFSGSPAVPVASYADLSDFSAQLAETVSGIYNVDMKYKGDVQHAIDDAHANGGGVVYCGVGEYNITETITVKEGVSLVGSGIGLTIFIKKSDVIGIRAENSYARLEGFTLLSGIEDTTDGVVIKASRLHTNFQVQGVGGHGVVYAGGNMNTFTQIVSIFNGKTGFYCNPSDSWANASTFGLLDVRDNGEYGFYLDGQSRDLTGGYILCFRNGLGGAYINTSRNKLTIYTEDNVSTLGVDSSGNFIIDVNGSFEDHSTKISNIILSERTVGSQFFTRLISKEFVIPTYNELQGSLTITQTDDREFKVIVGNSSSDQTLIFENTASDKILRLFLDYISVKEKSLFELGFDLNNPDGSGKWFIGQNSSGDLEIEHQLTSAFRRFRLKNRCLNLPISEAAPAAAQDGDIVYADGVTWNPGDGVGFYGREAGSWKKL